MERLVKGEITEIIGGRFVDFLGNSIMSLDISFCK
jgi:hypothetical protein